MRLICTPPGETGYSWGLIGVALDEFGLPAAAAKHPASRGVSEGNT